MSEPTEVKRRGKKPGSITAIPNKVLSPKFSRKEKCFEIAVPFNDQNGTRKMQKVLLMVVDGNLKSLPVE